MRLLTFYKDEDLRVGLRTDEGVIDVAATLGVDMTPAAFYALGSDGLEKLATLDTVDARKLDESTLTLGPCVPNPGKILCVGLNYGKHAAEAGIDAPTSPVLFSKFNNSLAAHGEVIPFLAEYTQLDYEAELVAVIGKRAKNVSVENALDYVLGYCNGNDLSERALQLGLPGGQWLVGKTADKFLPIGPYLVTADEVGDPQNLSIRGWLNGELRQDSNTSDMIFSLAEVIAYATRFMTLHPGDIISTGTPEGVIMGMAETVWLGPDDEYTVEIGNLGRLSNTIGASE